MIYSYTLNQKELKIGSYFLEIIQINLCNFVYEKFIENVYIRGL